MDNWAIHPGGKAILDKVSEALGLPPDRLDVPRAILREFGNMSSATILFVLQRFLEEGQPWPDGRTTLAAAFGPGLTVETTLLTLLSPALSTPQHRDACDDVACLLPAEVS